MDRKAAYAAGEVVGCRNYPRRRLLRRRATVLASAIRLPSYKSHSFPSRQGLSASQLQTGTTVGFEGFEGGERGARSQRYLR